VKRLGDGTKQQGVANAWVAAQKRMEPIGNREDDMVVLDGQQGLLLALEPAHLVESLALGAMAVAAGVV
jgi:hypothetical protein